MPLQLVQFVAKVKYKPILVNQNVKIVAKASTTKTVKTLPQQMTIAVIAKRAQVVGWQQRELNNAVVCAQDHTPILNKANALMQVRVNQVNLKKIKQVRVQIVPADILPCLYRWVNQKHVLVVGWSWFFTLFISFSFFDFIFIHFCFFYFIKGSILPALPERLFCRSNTKYPVQSLYAGVVPRWSSTIKSMSCLHTGSVFVNDSE